MQLILRGRVVELGEVREYVDQYGDTRRTITARVSDPNIKDERYKPMIEATGDERMAVVQDLVKTGAIADLHVLAVAVPGKARPWVKYVLVGVGK